MGKEFRATGIRRHYRRLGLVVLSGCGVVAIVLFVLGGSAAVLIGFFTLLLGWLVMEIADLASLT
jgi:hypothetical protein